MNEEVVIHEVLQSGLDDWIMLDEVTWLVMEGDTSPSKQADVLKVLQALYERGLAVPGTLGDGGFEDWPGSPHDWLTRSRAELDGFDWKPMGAGFWLRLTPQGETAAKGPNGDAS